MVPLDHMSLRLIDDWQRGFPLQPDPYGRIASDLGLSEASVLDRVRELSRAGVLSRVGAVVAPNTAGASTLAAMAVPPSCLDQIADVVNREPGVNHNYEREHRYNLWFVVTGPDRPALDMALSRIEGKAGLRVLDLPLRSAYHVDLGFPLSGGRAPCARRCDGGNGAKIRREVDADDRRLLCGLEDGLALDPRPYAQLAERLGTREADVIDRLRDLLERGVVKRLGLIVRHRELGYTANAMVVWDVDDARVDEIGRAFTDHPFVTLCYRRARRRPHWPYNLFCMIHGRDRATVGAQIEQLRACARDWPMDVLFSLRRFKQRGARLSVT